MYKDKQGHELKVGDYLIMSDHDMGCEAWLVYGKVKKIEKEGVLEILTDVGYVQNFEPRHIEMFNLTNSFLIIPRELVTKEALDVLDVQ